MATKCRSLGSGRFAPCARDDKPNQEGSVVARDKA
jgi:hypothetical protein